MKKFLTILLIVLCLVGCSSTPSNASGGKDLTNRKEYLEETLTQKENELFPEGYTVISSSISEVTIDGIDTVDSISDLIQKKDGTYEMVMFGGDNENLIGYKEHDVFHFSSEQQEHLSSLVKQTYPILANETKWVCVKAISVREDAYYLAIGLTKDQLQDSALMEELARSFNDGVYPSIFRIQDDCDPSLIEPYLLYNLYASPYDWNPFGRANAMFEDFIYLSDEDISEDTCNGVEISNILNSLWETK